MRVVVDGLSVGYETDEGLVKAVDDVSFEIEDGQQFGLVGESGCGKTTVAKSLIRLLPDNGRILEGSIKLINDSFELDIVKANKKELHNIRWEKIALISQSAMNALDPVYTIGTQIKEGIQLHENVSDSESIDRAKTLLDRVGLDKERVNSYPHQLSGGMRQRAMIAMALACDPDIIIADEPTTALDVITQDHILAQIDQLSKGIRNSLLMITHDISVVSETCDRVGVMYAGQLVEEGPVEDVFLNPDHPYTQGLLNAFPSLEEESSELITILGEPPDLIDPPAGCRFYDRCPYREPQCQKREPNLTVRDNDWRARCFVTEDGMNLQTQYENIMEENDKWQRL
jgi:peptide/nickel transport system ATP-binding protein